MPSTRQSTTKKPAAESPVSAPEALHQLLEGHRTPEAFFSANGLLDQRITLSLSHYRNT
jgi:hypothetical protein